MNGHQYSLGKLARRGVNLQISQLAATVRNSYHTRPNMVQSFKKVRLRTEANDPYQLEGHSEQQIQTVSGVNPTGKSTVRKVVGVKKTLVNQMQGMVRSHKPTKQVGPYKIYGKTRMFSSSSSLHGVSPVPITRRWMSSELKRKQRQQLCEDKEIAEEDSDEEAVVRSSAASLSATQRRFKQSVGVGRGMALKAARDISQSIQEELMVVDAETRNMLNSDPSRQIMRLDYQDQLPQGSRVTGDPLRGWHHPCPLKHLSNISVCAALENSSSSSAINSTAGLVDHVGRQVKPRRRQLVMRRASQVASATVRSRDNLNRSTEPKQFRALDLDSRAALNHLGELYSHTAKEGKIWVRADQRTSMGWQTPKTPVQDESDDPLMDVTLARAVRPDITVARGLKNPIDEESTQESRYEQPKSERDFLKQAFIGDARGKGFPTRLDDLHYEPTTSRYEPSSGSGISASQLVINNKFSSFRLSQAKGANRKRVARQIVDSVNPTPQLKPRAMTERFRRLQPASNKRDDVRHEGTRQATPLFSGGYQQQTKRLKVGPVEKSEWEEDQLKFREEDREKHQNNTQMRVRTYSRSAIQNLDQEKSTTRRESEPKVQRTRNTSTMGSAMFIGEKRELNRTLRNEPATQHNELTMPKNYSKESAVQRLGSIPGKQYNRAYNSY